MNLIGNPDMTSSSVPQYLKLELLPLNRLSIDRFKLL